MTRLMIILTLLCAALNCYAQSNVINIDTSFTDLTIYNYGTLIENNQGVVNQYDSDKNSSDLHFDESLNISIPTDDNTHYILTEDYRFSKDKVKINNRVYYNVNIHKSIKDEYLFRIIGDKAYSHNQSEFHIHVDKFTRFSKGNLFYVSKFENCDDEFQRYPILDGLDLSDKNISGLDLKGGVIIDYYTKSGDITKFIFAGILIIGCIGMMIFVSW